MSRKTTKQEIIDLICKKKLYVFGIHTGMEDYFRHAIIATNEPEARTMILTLYPKSVATLLSTATQITIA